jgi:hypothetical protein
MLSQARKIRRYPANWIFPGNSHRRWHELESLVWLERRHASIQLRSSRQPHQLERRCQELLQLSAEQPGVSRLKPISPQYVTPVSFPELSIHHN